jgi:hypothetical protein
MPRAVLAAAALLFAAFGTAFCLAPHRLAAMVDIPLATNTAVVDFIATYGGFELGFSIFLFTCLARPERVRLGLLASGWAVAGFAVSRAVALFAVGGAGRVMYGALAFETVCAGVAFVAAGAANVASDGDRVRRG